MARILINSSSYYHNLDYLAKHIGNKDKLALVLKDNAYGHGLREIAELAHRWGIKSVFVKNLQEAFIVADLFEHISIFYGDAYHGGAGYAYKSSCNISLPKNFHPVLQDASQILHLPKHSSIEIKINIGMNRNGIEAQDLQTVLEEIKKNKISVLGVFSHNAWADEFNEKFEEQEKYFEEIKQHTLKICQKLHLPIPRFHSLSSSGTVRTKNINHDLVRVGIGAYGYAPINFQQEEKLDLRPVLSLWCKKISTRFLKKGSLVGYGGSGIIDRDCYVSTYDVGYGDGIFRFCGKRFDGKFAKLFTRDGFEILPKSSMDCLSILSQEDEICLFEDVREFSEFFGTIPHETLTTLSAFLPRQVF